MKIPPVKDKDKPKPTLGILKGYKKTPNDQYKSSGETS